MCYDRDDEPPSVPPGSGAHRDVVTEGLTLSSTDGSPLGAFRASPTPGAVTGAAGGRRAEQAAILILPDNGGMSPFYEQFAVELARHGHIALGIDYYGRSAGPDYRVRDADFRTMDRLWPHLGQLTRSGLYADFAAGIDHLRGAGAPLSQAPPRPVLSIGFCLGGRFAFQTADPRFGLAGVIGLYGYPGELRGAPGPTQLAADFTAPVLGLFGGADEGIPPTVVSGFDAALTAAGVRHEFVVYPDAPHGFFEASLPEFRSAQEDAWSRMLAWIQGCTNAGRAVL